MKQQLTKQTEKFNRKLQAAAAYKGETDFIKQREKEKADATKKEFEEHGMVGSTAWKQAGFDPHDDSIAMLISWNGIEKLFQVNDHQKEIIAREVAAPLVQEINHLKNEVSELKSMMRQMLDLQMGIAPTTPKVEEISEPVLVQEIHVPLDSIKAAQVQLDNATTPGGRKKWSMDIVYAALTILQEEGVNIDSTGQLQLHPLGNGAYNYVNRAHKDINWKDVVARFKQMTKEAN
jgi:hypothetical protein